MDRNLEERFRQLLNNYRSDNISLEEEQELFRMIGLPEYHHLLEDIVQETLEAAPETGITMTGERLGTMLNAITSQQPKVHMVPFLRRYRWLAAAMLLLLGTGVYFLLPRSPQQVKVATKPDDVQPGGARAMLTLADGKTVPLDSTGSQVIQQGQVQVQQLNGQLQYNNTAAHGANAGPSYNTLTTPRGGFFSIALPDGSKVWLNAASSLKYPIAFHEKERVVELQGQAYFEIAANPHQPFRVRLGNGAEVEVLGTSFDIMAYADEKIAQTTLVAGAVKIKQAAVQAVLKPGQQALLDPSAHTLQVQPADVNQVIAWKTGFFEFANTDLATIMRQIERWYDVEVIYGHTHDNERFLGRISRHQPLTRILQLLEENGVKCRIEGRRITVLR
jgi:ferric-dicitrate binding protein FerR (iron transport regulator)